LLRSPSDSSAGRSRCIGWDRDTSGCLLLARNPKAHKRFTAAFEAGDVEKTYVAVVAGVPAETEGAIDLPLMKISSAEEGWRMTGNPRGKRAITRWRVIASRNGRSLIACFPETGRTHQIRIHLSEGLGLGIVGDPVYGAPAVEVGAPMLLHARSLSIPRGLKPPAHATAPVPERFMAAGFSEQDLVDAGL
jgi:tRNA pseudouridine32 synthase/23S rRNA pseudouridine746 synthase